MAASSPDLILRQVVLPRAMLVGAALGVVGVVGGSLLMRDVAATIAAMTGITATLLAALATGLWAGVGAAEAEYVPVRERWVSAGLATGAAGAFATFWTLSPQMAMAPFGRIVALLILIAAPAYTIGFLLPALVLWGERWEQEQEEQVTGWGTVGIIVIGVVVGLLVGVVAGGLALLPSYRPGPLLLATALTMLASLVLGDLPRTSTNERVIHESWSPFGELKVTEIVYPGERQPERRLYLNGEEESGELVRSGAPTLAYVAAAENWLANLGAPPGGHYLFLGGGAYTLPRRIAERDAGAHVTVVEVDPDVTRAAYRFFGLRRHHGVVSVHGDARAYLERAPADERFDRVFLDVYAGQETLPYWLATREAFLLLQNRLRPGGTVLINVIGVTEGSEARRLWSVIRTVADVFPSVAVYTHLGRTYPERQNVLVAAAAEERRPLPERAGWFEGWERAEWPDLSGAIVLRDLASTWRPAREEAEQLLHREDAKTPRTTKGDSSFP